MKLKLVALLAACAIALAACSSGEDVSELESQVEEMTISLVQAQQERDDALAEVESMRSAMNDADTPDADADTSADTNDADTPDARLDADTGFEIQEVISLLAALYPQALIDCGDPGGDAAFSLRAVADWLRECVTNRLGTNGTTDNTTREEPTREELGDADADCGQLPYRQLREEGIETAGECYRFWAAVMQFPFISEDHNSDEANCRFVARIYPDANPDADIYTNPSIFEFAYQTEADTGTVSYPTECPSLAGLSVGDIVEVTGVNRGIRRYQNVAELPEDVPVFEILSVTPLG